jgi:hypothetical protein
VGTSMQKISTLMTAAKDQYHGEASIEAYGAIRHANALAEVFVRSGEATDQAQAVYLASAEIAHLNRVARGETVNRDARMMLDEKSEDKVKVRRKSAHAKLAHP